MTASLKEVDGQLDRAAQVCAEHGVRFTELRREILSLILDAEGPVGAYDLLNRLKEIHKGAAPPTIYRALDFLMRRALFTASSDGMPSSAARMQGGTCIPCSS